MGGSKLKHTSLQLTQAPRLGLGQAPSKDGVGPTESISNDTKLRRQLLGRDYDKKRKREAMGGKKGGAIGSKPLPQQRQVDRNEESEEEAGRSALGKSKCKLPKFNGKVMNHATDGVDDTGDERLDRVSPEVTSSKRPPNGNFLDHLLAEKERKRKRKNRKKKRIAADKPVQA